MFPSGPLAEKLAGAIKPRQAEEPAQMELGL
jgi:hypothetical protein